MASEEDFKFDVKPGHDRKLFQGLKEENLIIDDVLDTVKEFWYMPEETIAKFDDRKSLSEFAVPAEKFAGEQIDIVLKLRHEIQEKMTILEICLLAGDPLPPHRDGFVYLVSEIKKIQESILHLLENIDKNQDVCSFLELLETY